MESDRKKVFISYSWEDAEHQEWVLNLAKDLQGKYGLIILLDRLNNPGFDLPYFMEQSIDKADKVLAILTPDYKIKAENRERGVGYESTILSQELFDSPITKIKVIPVLRKGDKANSVPKFLISKNYISMIDDEKYDYHLLDLAKSIYEQPLVEMPEVGPIPDFKSKDIDPFIAKANSIASEEAINKEINQLLSSPEGKRIADDEISRFIQIIKDKKTLYENNTDLRFSFEENYSHRFIIRSYGFSITITFDNIFSNAVSDLKMKVRYIIGNMYMNGGFSFPDEKPRLIKEEEYKFDLTYKRECVWKMKSKIYDSEQISVYIFEFLMDEIQKIKSKDFRGR